MSIYWRAIHTNGNDDNNEEWAGQAAGGSLTASRLVGRVVSDTSGLHRSPCVRPLSLPRGARVARPSSLGNTPRPTPAPVSTAPAGAALVRPWIRHRLSDRRPTSAPWLITIAVRNKLMATHAVPSYCDQSAERIRHLSRATAPGAGDGRRGSHPEAGASRATLLGRRTGPSPWVRRRRQLRPRWPSVRWGRRHRRCCPRSPRRRNSRPLRGRDMGDSAHHFISATLHGALKQFCAGVSPRNVPRSTQSELEEENWERERGRV